MDGYLLIRAFLYLPKKNQQQYAAVKSSSPAIVAKANSKQEIINVEIKQLLASYEGNEIKSDRLYKDKLIMTTGIVDKIKKDLFDSLYVTIGTGARFELPQLQAYFDHSMSEKLSELN